MRGEGESQVIREIDVRDSVVVTKIIRTALGYETDVETVAAQIERLRDNEEYVTLVWADEGDAVGGFIHGVRYQTLHRVGGWDVISLAVAPDCQGQGIGTELLRGFEDRIRASGATYVRLNSRVERAGAHAFYEHCGYVADKLQKRFIRTL